MTKKDGRHPLPDKKDLQALFEKHGLHYDDAIYIYDQGASPFATRAWWILNYAGFHHAYIVNGGYQSLLDVGLTATATVPNYEP